MKREYRKLDSIAEGRKSAEEIASSTEHSRRVFISYRDDDEGK